MLKAIAWGGAGEHGRSCYWVQKEETSILFDCGGKKQDGGLYPALDPDHVKHLNAVFLSHAHEDHSAALPLLIKLGYTGDIWTTRETYQQLGGYAQAWHGYVKRSGGEIPYDQSDWNKLNYRFLDDEAPPDCWFQLSPDIRACWRPSGHLLGAVWILLELNGSLVYFSGDYSSESLLLQSTLPTQSLANGKQIELAIIDSAYGTDSRNQQEHISALINKIKAVHARGGHALLPVPITGRGQDLLVLLLERVQEIPLAVEEKLLDGIEVLQQPTRATMWLHRQANELLSRIKTNQIRIIRNDKDRMALLNAAEKPHIILSYDGMLLAEPALTYYHSLKNNSRNAVLFTGQVSKHAFIQEHHPCELGWFRYKVHQGKSDVQLMIERLQPNRTLLVHSEYTHTVRLIQELTSLGYKGLYTSQPE